MNPDQVKAARKALGMTQQQLADALELSGENAAATIRSWESGRRPISGPARVAIRLLVEQANPRNRPRHP